MGIEWIIGGAIVAGIILAGEPLHVVRPTERVSVERLGKFKRVKESGLVFTLPYVEKIIRVNTTEHLVDAEPQEIITKDNLNARVDAQVYFRIKRDEESIKSALYNVNNVEQQIVQLARTTLRNVIGTMTLVEANSGRNIINKELAKTLVEETKNWGIEIVRTELKEIDPPKDVQETMNKIVIAENEKISAIDFATAAETKADGSRRAAIKEAEGIAKAIELNASAKANAVRVTADAKAYEIQKVNESAQNYFKNEAQTLRKLEVSENVFAQATKVIMDKDSSLVTLLDNVSGIVPIKTLPSKEETKILQQQMPSTTGSGTTSTKSTKQKSFRNVEGV